MLVRTGPSVSLRGADALRSRILTRDNKRSRTLDLDEIYRLLRGAHVQAQGVVNTLRDPLLVLDPDLTIISANPAFYRVFDLSRDATVGSAFYDLGEGQWNIDELRLLLEKVIPKSASVFDYEVEATFPDLGTRTMLVTAQRLVHPDNGRRLLMLTIVDATERRRKERQQDILLNEWQHRMKNVLAVTQALARQTRTKDRSATQFRDDFLNRFTALGRSLEISTRQETAQLGDLVRDVLKPFSAFDSAQATGLQIEDGPEVRLMPRQTMALGMILQELATNAIKHGAWSGPTGTVTLTWIAQTATEGRDTVRVTWAEQGGPAVCPPTKPGFGTKLIDASVKHELAGSAEPEYRPEGFQMTLAFPLY